VYNGLTRRTRKTISNPETGRANLAFLIKRNTATVAIVEKKVRLDVRCLTRPEIAGSPGN